MPFCSRAPEQNGGPNLRRAGHGIGGAHYLISPLPSAVAFPASGAWLCWSLENCTGSERGRPRTSPVVVGGVTIIQPTIHLTRNETIVARQRHTTITVAPRCRRAEIATAQTIS